MFHAHMNSRIFLYVVSCTYMYAHLNSVVKNYTPSEEKIM